MEKEIRVKQKRIDTLEKDTKVIREELQGTLSYLDFICICSLFTVTNGKSFYIMMIKMEIKKKLFRYAIKRSN